MAQDGAVWAVAVAFIVNGLLTMAVPSWGGANWIISGVVALLVGWYGVKMMK